MSRSFRRRPATREIGRRVLIACEGSKTEPGYFDGIRQALRLSTERVLVIPHEGTDPRSVVRAAVARRNEQRRDGRWTERDTAWAVYDGEEHLAANPTNWHEAIQIAQTKDIRLAISNPCFELWYLLHYQDQSAYLTRQQARHALKQYLPDYEKSNRLYPEPLKDLTREAIRRAKALDSRAQANELPAHENPCCGVVYLVESLLDLSNE